MAFLENSELDPVVRRFVENAGNFSRSLGAGRVIGQAYALFFFSADPLNLLNLQKILGISKGSASTAVRQLEQWRAVRKVWIKGDRKDYYVAEDWLGGVLRSALADTIGKKLGVYSSLLDQVERELGDKDGFIRIFNTQEEALEYVKKFDGVLYYQIVELKRG